ncbi:MAG: class I SAM-dependent methyltransferase [Sphingobacteriaceae bacterium]|nr:class I SAM-dependent methyltransferase [Sphingobacteriaceae bacterium]
MNLYKNSPLKFVDEIPVFSETDKYINNYEEISKVHITELSNTGHNPFIPESQWMELELSTVRLIRKYVKENDKTLDIGVGLGRTLSHFQNIKKHGVDISLDYLKISKSKGIDCALAKIEELPYNNNYFDLIVCTDVLEHMIDLNIAIKNILNILKPGGHFIMRVPYREDLSQYLKEDYPFYFVHIRNFDEHQLNILFKYKFNCKVIEWNSVGDVISENRMIEKVKYYGRFWKFYQWKYKFIKKHFPTLFKNMHYKCEINLVIQKTL